MNQKEKETIASYDIAQSFIVRKVQKGIMSLMRAKNRNKYQNVTYQVITYFFQLLN